MSTVNTVYDQLRAAIIDGTFSSGAPLRQDLIARDYGVSKIPVREAKDHLTRSSKRLLEALTLLRP